MFWGFSVLFSTVFLFSVSPAFAQNKCSSLFEKADLALTPNTAPNPAEKIAEEFATRIAEMESMQAYLSPIIDTWKGAVGDKLTLNEIGIQLFPEQLAVYSNFGFSLNKGKVVNLGLKLGHNSARERDAIFAHEFGHALFMENMLVALANGNKVRLEDIASQGEIQTRELLSNPVYLNLQKDINDLGRALEMARNLRKEELVSDLEKLLETKSAELRKINDLGALSENMHHLLIGYNELFADSFAVLMFKDPKIMTHATSSEKYNLLQQLLFDLSYRGNNGEKLAPRDFSQTVSFKDWKHEHSDIYTLLDPARGVLWKLYIKNIKDENRGLFLKTFLDAVSSHLTAQMANGPLKPATKQETDLKLFNQEFIKHFRDAAIRNGLPIAKD